ncbi:DNA-binding protein [Phocaeicola dorei]|nr:helix-turn-helix domain-containing protein [Phocaeicola dorei]MCE8447095.1 DNA-binding protein [Phocaeicola dorei]
MRLNISLRTLQTFRDTGKLPYSQINHKMYYKTEDVESLLLYVQNNRLKKLRKNK